MSYSIDIYRKKLKPVNNILDLGFYVSFFPQLVAGPIVRASEFIPQIQKPYNVSKKDFGMALFWILNGLLKKFLLADYIAVNFVDRVFDNPGMFSGFENLMALYGYSLQVCRFSVTDIAIGIALIWVSTSKILTLLIKQKIVVIFGKGGIFFFGLSYLYIYGRKLSPFSYVTLS